MTRARDQAGGKFSTADNLVNITLESTDADANVGPVLDLYRNSASPADSDIMGNINYKAENSAGEIITYVNLIGVLGDVTDGTEDGQLRIQTMTAGANVNRISVDTTETVINDTSKDLDFRVESDNDANALFVQGSDGNVGIGTGSPNTAADLHVADTSDTRIWLEATSGDTLELYAGTGVSLFNRSNNPLTFGTNNTERFRVLADGDIVVARTSNDLTAAGISLEAAGTGGFVRSGGPCLILNRLASDGEIIRLVQAGTTEGTISSSGSTISYNTFTGSHWSQLTDGSKPTILAGTVLETIDEMCVWYQAEYTIPEVKYLEGDSNIPEGKSVGDVKEEKIDAKDSIALPSGKKVGDTFTHTVNEIDYTAKIIKENDNKHVRCKISTTEESTSVYGVFMAWDEDDKTVNDMYVNAVGTTIVRIHKDQTISKGDLLVSNGDGTAKKQDDDIIRSKTIGKALTNIKQETYDDGSYTIPCALYCG
mgnify:CR=1 FL=1